MWPSYSAACRNAVNELLLQGGSLSAFRANKDYGAEPKINSYAHRLERQLEMRMGVKYAVVVNSGTAALHCALQGLGLGKLGEVITSPYTFSATVSAIILAGGVPVFADVDPQTFCITKETVKRAITKKTKAIVPVSLFGVRADLEGLLALGPTVIEDGCQAVGGEVRDDSQRRVHRPYARAFSFNGTKNVPAGECGAVLFDSQKAADKARLVMNHAENFGVDQIGYNYRPNEVTCAIAYHGLLELHENNRQRIMLAEALTSYILGEPKLKKYIDIPSSVKFDGSHVFYVYPFKLKGMDRRIFAKRMQERFGIGVGQGYINPTLEKYVAFKKYAKAKLDTVTDLSERSLCLFSHVTPGNSVREMERTVEAMVGSVRQ